MVYGVVRMFMYVNVMLSHIIMQLYYDRYSHPSAVWMMLYEAFAD